MRPIIILGIVIFAALGSARADDLVGVPVITDGDTVIVAGEKIRLQGIDAPETDQICLDTKGSDWQCGLAARDALIAKAGQATWHCAISVKDAYTFLGRVIGLHHCHFAMVTK